MAPYISIIIPTLNRYEDLMNTIQYLLNQDFNEFEIIIVDQSLPRKELLNDLPQVKVYYQSESSASAARNLGIAKSEGEVLLFLDDDVIIENRGFLRCYYNEYIHSSVPGIVGRVMEKGQEVKMTRHWMSKLKNTGWLFFPQNYGIRTFVDVGRSCNLSVRRNIAIDVKGMDENFQKGAHREEADFCLRVRRKYGQLLYLPEAYLYHIGNPKGGIRNWNNGNTIKAQHHFDGAMYFLLKNVSIIHYLPHMLSMYLFFIHKNLSIKRPHLLLIICVRLFKSFIFSLRKRISGPKYLQSLPFNSK